MVGCQRRTYPSIHLSFPLRWHSQDHGRLSAVLWWVGCCVLCGCMRVLCCVLCCVLSCVLSCVLRGVCVVYCVGVVWWWCCVLCGCCVWWWWWWWCGGVVCGCLFSLNSLLSLSRSLILSLSLSSLFSSLFTLLSLFLFSLPFSPTNTV